MKRLNSLILCFLAVLCQSFVCVDAQELESQQESFVPVTFTEDGQAKPLQAGAKVKKVWTVESARKEAMTDAEAYLDTAIYPSRGPYRAMHLKAMAQKSQISGNRLITTFSGGGYSVTEKCSKVMFYYYPDGRLGVVEKMTSVSFGTPKCMPFYPNKSYSYRYPSGVFSGASVKVGLHEQFAFAADGELLRHWKDERCYKADGKPCGTRKSYISK